MALFGLKTDIDLFKSINMEMLSDIKEQMIGYYKLNLEESRPDIYGEDLHKVWYEPVLIPCEIQHGDYNTKIDSSILNVDRNITIFFLKDILKECNIYPERGDFIVWNDNEYELKSINENQYIVGKVPEYNYSENYLDEYGDSFSIECLFVYISPEKSNLNPARI